MIEILLGMLGAIIGAGLFVGGFLFGQRTYKPKPIEIAEPTPEQIKQAEEARIQYEEDEAAFKTLMSYNIDKVYENYQSLQNQGVSGDVS